MSHETGAVQWGERSSTRAVAAAVVLAYGWWATGLPPFSRSAALAVVGAGVLMMAAGTTRRPAPRPGSERRAVPPMIICWLLLALALGAWQLQVYLQHPRGDHPTLSSLTNALLDTQPARTVALAAWLGAAYRLATARR